MGNGERVEEGWGLLGNPSHPWSGVYGAVLGQTGTDISPVKVKSLTLESGLSKYVPLIALRGASFA